jgi:hypothetical protein
LLFVQEPHLVICSSNKIKAPTLGAQASCLHERLSDANRRFDYLVVSKECKVDVRAGALMQAGI